MPNKDIKEYGSISEFLAENNVLGKQLEVTVDGAEIKSLHGSIPCVYAESGKLYDNGSYRFRNSENEFYLLIKGEYKVKVKQQAGALRLFISASYERSFKEKGDSGKNIDYCLQKGKKYYMAIGKESHDYGPPDEGGKRPSNSITYIQISDKEFKNGKPQVEQTPTVKNWIYG